jgi:tRNA-Thr(GGU) m(6)t(6)A37 methyltransferase TsaA
VEWLSVAFPLRPIGVLRSVFGRRNGTPRQPGLVPAARAELRLRPDLPPGLLAGLEGFSHCWLLYVFHQNTDLQRLWQGDYRGVRASVRVPRLDGGRRGALATRAPHRPCPIGLSLARVLAVDGGRLVLGGADVLDGTPVLDVKPFTWADAAPGATAPAWVAAEAAAAEPLALGAVRLAPGAEAALRAGWAARGAASLYATFEGLRELVLQALARDVRSVTQRKKVPGREREGRGVPALAAPAAAALPGAAREGKWHIVLDGLDISYDVDDGGGVEVVGARLAGAAVEGDADPG